MMAMSLGGEGTASYLTGAMSGDEEQAVIALKVAPAVPIDEEIAAAALEPMGSTDGSEVMTTMLDSLKWQG